MAKTQISLLDSQDELDLQDVVEWMTYGDDLMQAIRDGYMDQMLKEIARAAIDRAKSIGQVPDKKVAPQTLKVTAGPARPAFADDNLDVDVMPYAADKISSRPGRARRKSTTSTGSTVASKGLLDKVIKPLGIEQISLDDKDMFQYRAQMYRKSDFVGYVVYLNDGVIHKWAGKYLHVSGIGAKSVKVAPVNTSDRSMMTLPLGGDYGFVDKKFFATYFG